MPINPKFEFRVEYGRVSVNIVTGFYLSMAWRMTLNTTCINERRIDYERKKRSPRWDTRT